MTLVFVFYLAFTPLSIWWGVALTRLGWNEYLVLGLTMIANFALEFLWTRYVVYRKSINSAENKKANSKSVENNEVTTTEA
jgi:fucose permease